MKLYRFSRRKYKHRAFLCSAAIKCMRRMI
uniref:Uncharacterized protein n=1 Tax=Siphoviridae sp. ctD6g5 TaxID=2826196 RepID=A0A8S5MRP6_9CAUD|nr:MAG TPA: hypothetical protein [Siphoviridae sp. ctD6g5]